MPDANGYTAHTEGMRFWPRRGRLPAALDRLRAVAATMPPLEDEPGGIEDLAEEIAAWAPARRQATTAMLDDDLMARYERLCTGPDAVRVADALARDWRAVGGYLDEALKRAGRGHR